MAQNPDGGTHALSLLDDTRRPPPRRALALAPGPGLACALGPRPGAAEENGLQNQPLLGVLLQHGRV
eukprot:8459452-Lingulodinium_polyedra.AAC.1